MRFPGCEFGSPFIMPMPNASAGEINLGTPGVQYGLGGESLLKSAPKPPKLGLGKPPMPKPPYEAAMEPIAAAAMLCCCCWCWFLGT